MIKRCGGETMIYSFCVLSFLFISLIISGVGRRFKYKKIENGILYLISQRHSIDFSKNRTLQEIEKLFFNYIDIEDFSSAGVFLQYIKNSDFLNSCIKKCFSRGGFLNFEMAILMIKFLEREPTIDEYNKLIDYDLENGFPVYAILRAEKIKREISEKEIKTTLKKSR